MRTRRAFLVKYKVVFIIFIRFLLVKYIKIGETTILNLIKWNTQENIPILHELFFSIEKQNHNWISSSFEKD